MWDISRDKSQALPAIRSVSSVTVCPVFRVAMPLYGIWTARSTVWTTTPWNSRRFSTVRYAHVYACTRTWMHTHTCMHARRHTCMHACMHTHVHAGMPPPHPTHTHTHHHTHTHSSSHSSSHTHTHTHTCYFHTIMQCFCFHKFDLAPYCQ